MGPANRCGKWCYRADHVCDHNRIDTSDRAFICSGIGGKCHEGSRYEYWDKASGRDLGSDFLAIDKGAIRDGEPSAAGPLRDPSAPGLEALAGLERMTINQCQRLAKEFGGGAYTFNLCGPKGKMKCTWLDAYMGFFEIEGQKGFVMVKHFEMAHDIWCEGLRPPKELGA